MPRGPGPITPSVSKTPSDSQTGRGSRRSRRAGSKRPAARTGGKAGTRRPKRSALKIKYEEL
jgi:hypothetical protein